MTRERAVELALGPIILDGDLVLPAGARGLVLFAHGSGSSRFSPRNRLVAAALHEAGIATLLFDLLTPEEEMADARTGVYRFDIPRLADRLVGVTDWVAREPATAGLLVGYFGASTGAAAALIAAARRPDVVAAVVSRGGRVDLADGALSRVAAPTLLIVGAHDLPVLELNRGAMEGLGVESRLEMVAGASHLFEEPGAVEEVVRLGRRWFERHLAPPRATRRAG